MRLVLAVPLRPRRAHTARPPGLANRTRQPLLHVLAEPFVRDQLRDLRSAGPALGVPLRDRRLVLEPPRPRRRVTTQLPRDRRRASAPAAARSPAHRRLALEGARSPPARQTTGSGPTRLEKDMDSRRQRGGTTGTQPATRHRASPAASSVFSPRATAAQNRTRSSRHATVGRPGEGTCPRYS